MRDQIPQDQRQTDPDRLVELIKSNNTEASEEQISQVSEIALQECFGLIAQDVDLKVERHLRWVHGLLCLLEKPLLPDQAADLNMLLNKLLEVRETQKDGNEQLAAMLNLNIAIITEYFEQRFK